MIKSLTREQVEDIAYEVRIKAQNQFEIELADMLTEFRKALERFGEVEEALQLFATRLEDVEGRLGL